MVKRSAEVALRALPAGSECGVQRGCVQRCHPRWQVRFAVAVLLGFLSPAIAQAQSAPDESVVLPFQCQVDRGRVTLTPAIERAHKILGPRASHAFTACQPGQPDRCRTWQLHKFDLACSGGRVSWLAVVAAALEQRSATRAKVEQGRLSLRLGPQWRGAATQPSAMLAFPVGYAPTLGIGARFIGGSAAQPTVVEARPVAAEPKTAPPKVEIVAPAPSDLKAPEETAPAPSTLSSWQTTVNADDVPTWQLNMRRAVAALGGALALWGVLVLLRRREAASPVSAEPTAPPVHSQDAADEAAICAELISRAVNLHRASRDALPSIASDSLRDILATDLATVQRSLLAPDLTADVAEGRWAAAKSTVVQALTDLERVARIITGVLTTPTVAPLNTERATPSLPQTAAEAFEILGINPDASRTVIKKVVDGLRQSWHPDHARNDNDRANREERMKQINVAWDLIRGQRTEEQTAA